MLERYMCRQADHLALVAAYFRELVVSFCGVSSDRLTVTYNGSDFQNLASCEKERARSSLGIGKDEKLILYVGRLDWHKRIHLLIQAMPAILERVGNARLLLVGEGDQRRDLECLIKRLDQDSYVLLCGWIEHRGLQEVYYAADCLCLPSIYEGLPKVILEAMSVGIPVVASDIPAHRDVLYGGKAGFLVEKPDPACWASTLCEVLANPGEANRRAQQAAELVEERYRWAHVAERLDEVYKRLVKPK
jgi:glycosyltransferase involved in cell wall biosynthesis